MNRLAALLLALAALAACGQEVASVEPATNDGVCSGTHLSAGQATSYTYTAPPGKLVAGYCVKAGSANQGNGPEYHDVAPPQQSVTFSHSSGKEISHFSVELVDAPPPDTDPPTTPETSAPSTTSSPSTAPPSTVTLPSTVPSASVPASTSTSSTATSVSPTTTDPVVPRAPLPEGVVHTVPTTPATSSTVATSVTPEVTQPEPFCTTHPSAEGCSDDGLPTGEGG